MALTATVRWNNPVETFSVSKVAVGLRLDELSDDIIHRVDTQRRGGPRRRRRAEQYEQCGVVLTVARHLQRHSRNNHMTRVSKPPRFSTKNISYFFRLLSEESRELKVLLSRSSEVCKFAHGNLRSLKNTAKKPSASQMGEGRG